MTDEKVLIENFVFNEKCDPKFQEHFAVHVWCDGRLYDPSIEAYRPVYSYRIVDASEGWEYLNNDIFGLPNAAPDLLAGMKSLLSFLIASQEGLPEDQEGKRDGAEMFPLHVREFAYLMKEELLNHYAILEKKVG